MSSLSLFILVILSYGTLAQPTNNNPLYNQCATFPFGNICFVVTSNDCLDLTGTITVNGQQLISPQSVPIGRFLGVFQRRLSDPSFANGPKEICQALLPINGATCNACSTVSNLTITGPNLHYCGSLSVNCTILGVSYVRDLKSPCVDLQDCQSYGCQNNCSNAGTCTPYGLCRCIRGHSGFDCSTSISNNCISTSSIPKSCWKFNFPDCKTVEYQVDTPAKVNTQRINLDSGSSFALVPCQKFSNPTLNNMNCEICVQANSLKVIDDKLIGCPTVVISCNKREVSNTQLDCLTLAQSPALVCSNPNSNTENNSTSLMGPQNTAKTILIAMSAILGLALLGTGGYLIATKVIGGTLPFQKVESYMPEDVEPLNKVNGTIQDEESAGGTHGEDLEEDSV